jgi:transcriptional regulator of acetoin/glycerol metabolism
MATGSGTRLLRGNESHPDRVHSAVERQPAMPGIEEVSTSWRRCLSEYRVDPGSAAAPHILTPREFTEARGSVEELLTVAQPENDRLHATVGKIGYAVLLTSMDGVVVDFRNDPARDREFKQWGLWKGGIWAENVEGTNGIGTCIAEERPITVHRAQHFRSRYSSLSCCGAPVFGPDGKMAAVLDVTSIDPDVSERAHALALVVALDSARAIEDSLFLQRFRREWNIFFAGPVTDGKTLKLAVNEDLQIVGAGRYSRSVFGLDDSQVAAGVSLWKLFERMPLHLRRTGGVTAAQFTRIGHSQAWHALILPPETSAPDTRRALAHARTHVRGAGQPAEPAHGLSPREAAILDLIGKGRSNKQIAQELRIAPETVKTHVKHIFDKLDVERRAQAVSRAQSLGLITPG